MGCSRGSQRIVEVLGQTDLLLEMAEINATFRYAKKSFKPIASLASCKHKSFTIATL